MNAQSNALRSGGGAPGLTDLPVVWLEIAVIAAADSPRLRGEDLEHVRRLTESEDRLPPILVQRDSMRVIDGMHRLLAARSCGQNKIEARLVDCDPAEAFVLAVRANVKHGLPLPLPDRKAAALRILADFPTWSNQRVGEAVGLSGKTVAALRERPTGAQSGLDIRVGRDGRSRPANPSARRTIVERLIEEHPELSLRSIARKAGVSPETVRKTRASHAHASAGIPKREPALDPPKGMAATAPAVARDGPGAQVTARQTAIRDLLNSLMADPAVRSTEAGRALIRAIAFSAVITEYQDRLMKAVPDHTVAKVVLAAEACSDGWRTFALGLQRRSRPRQIISSQD